MAYTIYGAGEGERRQGRALMSKDAVDADVASEPRFDELLGRGRCGLWQIVKIGPHDMRGAAKAREALFDLEQPAFGGPDIAFIDAPTVGISVACHKASQPPAHEVIVVDDHE